MKKTIILLVIIATSLNAVSQTFPYGINYQAVARDANGNAQVSTSTPLRFSIYKTSPTGTMVWQETQAQMTNSMGQFNAVIGTGLSTGAGTLSSFSAINWANDIYFFKVELQTGISTFVQIGATTQFQSVPYSLAAPDPTPAGVVSAFAGVLAPTGYVLCQGQAVSRTGIYANLFAVIGIAYGSGDGSTTFNVPDFRGMFLRGLDGTAGNDPDNATRTASGTGGNTGNTVGSEQTDAMQGHRHGWRGNKTFSTSGGGAGWLLRGNLGSDTNYPANDGSIILDPAADGVNGTPRIAPETRPKNIYVNYIIKY